MSNSKFWSLIMLMCSYMKYDQNESKCEISKLRIFFQLKVSPLAKNFRETHLKDMAFKDYQTCKKIVNKIYSA